jgi:quercetin dioxygenase-like cupin family protein
METPVKLRETGIQSFDLDQVAQDLGREDAYRASRRAAASLVKEDDLTVVLTAVLEGETIREHAVPNAAFIMLLEGEIVVRFADEETHLTKGQSVAFAGGERHSVYAPQDARFLVVLGGSPALSHLTE